MAEQYIGQFSLPFADQEWNEVMGNLQKVLGGQFFQSGHPEVLSHARPLQLGAFITSLGWVFLYHGEFLVIAENQINYQALLHKLFGPLYGKVAVVTKTCSPRFAPLQAIS